jgi:hypothetical protein
MNCCINCFEDQELKGFIISNSTRKANCDYCNSKNVALVDPREFQEMFMLLLDIYKPVEKTDKDDINPALLHEKVQANWSIFSQSIKLESRKDLLQDILIDSIDKSSLWYSKPIEQKFILENAEQTETLEKWHNFTKEIKQNNRYFLGENIDLELLKDLFDFHTKSYKKGKIFYRARVCDENGLNKDKMGKPPSEKATSGRANPIGIPYLYVSTDHETVIHECRATHLDYLTVAEFKLKEDIKVVSLRGIENISPFLIGEDLQDYLKNQRYLKTLEAELSKPLRRHDHKLDYLPTQYLCEYIKSIGNDAIEYGSSLNKGGINLAIFSDDKVKLLKTTLHEVTSMDLETEPVE